ncbi:cytosine permease [Actinoplanes sp. NBRC 101535]|uniref:purine-cytosine permease family protein n=1 Tax=Actinoplanes sp. NBRC 101535 TaxID=3032196 RepID=UPI0024A3DBB3|nr:cytosine permease [Actinoplanes sp. NBRC 101535]GLY02705.1 cytosine permease [Actinoplanes sp. NBRC 101535]
MPDDRTLVADMDDHALEAVPASQRKPLLQLIVVQVGWNISVSSFLVGGVVGAGTTFGEGMAAIGVGNLVLAVVASLIGIIGFRTGLTSYLASRAVFGRSGSVVVSIVLGVIAMGFIGVLMDTWGGAVHKLIPAIPSSVFVIGFALAILTTAIFGFKGLHKFSMVAVPVQVAIGLFALFRIGSLEGGFGAVFDASPAASIGFSAAVSSVIATWVTGAALVSDVQRYALKARDVVISCVLSFVVGVGIFEVIATVSAMKVGNSNFVVVMQGLGLLAPAAVLLFLALWNTADNNIYSASLAFTSASNLVKLKISKPVWTVVAVVIAVAIAFLGVAGQFGRFLTVIGVVVPPFAGLLIAHFWILERRVENVLKDLPAVRWEAVVCWIAAALLAYYTDFLLANAIEGLVAGFVLHTLAGMALKKKVAA